MSKLGRYSAQRKKVQAVTASYTVTVADCGTIFIVDPTTTTNLTMPSPSAAGAGWWCKVILAESDGAADTDMDQKVNISFDGERLYGRTFGADGDTGTIAAAASSHDWINCSVDSTSGDSIDIVTDGTSWFAEVLAFDASTITFGTGAA